MMNTWVKYAIPVAVCVLVIAGTYYCGYMAGKQHAELKVVKETVEVIKYVEKQKASIYSFPDIGRDTALQLFNDNIL